ncbi:glycoside hydrolase family 88 protein [Arenicella xantha]|uniref:Rhamnogalacturonyl hydrolase YesR n=1 Tax=Arenicella xantha TaxID=644221 RepID=A0A395JTT7_9GAMM|nr:glycoside hydrolase family 88 protein [Arenicella xantha]RBP53008.1 rhamnogalacturonyl hydrolase YesR [Arenicella xantha]
MKTTLLSSLIAAILGAGSTGLAQADGHAESAKVNEVKSHTLKVDEVARVDVANPSDFARPDSLIRFSLNELGTSSQALQVWLGDQAVPTQLIDSDADGVADQLAFLASLDAKQTNQYVINNHVSKQQITARTQAEVSIKDGGEWQDKVYVGGTFKNVSQVTPPSQYTDHSEYIRYEGPGIESDQVGYRIYLDWRNGFDIFGKKTSDLVLQDVGQDGYASYHEMSDWGADILKVGSSLGAGGYGYWTGEKVELVSKVKQRSTAIKVNGPLYSALDIDYQGWDTGSNVVDLTASLAMQAGSPMVDVELRTSEPLSNLAIGLVAHQGTELLTGDLDITGEAWSYVASFGKQSLFDDNLAMVLLFKKRDFIEQTQDENSYVVVLQPRGTYVQYAFGALWSGQPGGVQTKQELETYLHNEVERRTLAPRIRLQTAASKVLAKQTPAEIATGLSKSEVARRGDSLIYGQFDDIRERGTQWTYTTGLLMQALDDVSQLTGDAQFSDYGVRIMDSYLDPKEAIKGYDPSKHNIDDINGGKMIQRLYQRSNDPRYRKAIDALAASLEDHPRTSEGALWHKLRYPHQLWLDGVYMGMPFLAGVGLMQGDEHKVQESVNEFVIARSHLRDPDTGLYFHAWDEAKQQVWADPETGRSRYVWSRGLGWYAMALVDILDVIPADKTELRQPLLDIIPELASSLLETQDESGVWYQIMDMPDATGNYLEASGTAMFTYFLAKAIDQGYLPDTYRSATLDAYEGLVNEFVSIHADGTYHLNNICEVAGLGYGRDGSYHYYMSERLVSNDPKGLAPAIMASVQISKLLNSTE